ncbi:beta-ketoacyl-ACP synthase II [Sediminibacterium sp.]|jgi:3-oxoacyl-[acyl-carrier-protein] synthase II|uniref:beta-ketoacyl-ACP synthase II n=1 Tax=Sediminibacterium sp. TaxID=1917865 RepID=UPI000BD7C830|nr:beta-ketoacyl-ACP synthase II [Sediminibacterium sp.]OYY11762.1 MAG: beta-ketoacyl-[acyl-carrier-protein] synthase II [Sphingobacteriia bacterium 35-36-14]OYZ53334.1 MAG: beta-ketoacyl-[acyl-carrier-protein] synthase II [Sphingobacteriia bacterium 24-36-13]OZA64050.1 MAG: beta-ketoacyl-[acyl-carrier-protein] synthase II [Sphingobacteriia bacterium 39-36-14]MDO8996405.1 beta-ketoacyl-ACP synthase II [Sediminibacterium sp.]MDP1972520.1 beta-ketoacyl-ACP synthase II [Sediminibacterium sp.]
MQLKRVVVTGIGTITPIGNNLEDYWQGLLNGVPGAAPITLFDASKFKTRFACEVKGFDPTSFMEKKEARKLDRFAQLALYASDMAVADAQINKENIDADRVGVIFASGIGGLRTFQEEVQNFATGDGTPRFNPFFIPKMILDIAAGQISMRHGFRGPNFAVVSACASSTNGIIAAVDTIRLGKADIIISGGSEAVISEAGVGGFNAMKAMSERNDDPATASRPYDKDRDGFVMGEAAGCLVLEEYEHAIKRGAKIYCEIAGGGATADAYHLTAPHPEGLGARNVMIAALKDAGMQPDEIDYINTHGTSTPLGDGAEAKAITEVFGSHAYNLNISATKSMTGHCLGAAGVIEAIACIQSVIYDIIPPTINHFTDDPELDPKLNFTFNKAQQRTVRAALSNTFGFGGHNACVIVKKYVA